MHSNLSITFAFAIAAVISYTALLMAKRKGQFPTAWAIVSFVFPPSYLILWIQSSKSDLPKKARTKGEHVLEIVAGIISSLQTMAFVAVIAAHLAGYNVPIPK